MYSCGNESSNIFKLKRFDQIMKDALFSGKPLIIFSLCNFTLYAMKYYMKITFNVTGGKASSY